MSDYVLGAIGFAPNETKKECGNCSWVGMYAICNRRANALENALREYVKEYPAFDSKPIGAPGSQMREEQDRHIAMQKRAIAALRGE